MNALADLGMALAPTIKSALEALTPMIKKVAEWIRQNPKLASGIMKTVAGFALLSLGQWKFLNIAGRDLFDVFDFVTGQIFLPVGGLLTCLFLGWYVPKKVVKDEFTNWGTIRGTFFGVYYFLVRYVCPLAILMIFLHQFNVV